MAVEIAIAWSNCRQLGELSPATPSGRNFNLNQSKVIWCPICVQNGPKTSEMAIVNIALEFCYTNRFVF